MKKKNLICGILLFSLLTGLTGCGQVVTKTASIRDNQSVTYYQTEASVDFCENSSYEDYEYPVYSNSTQSAKADRYAEEECYPFPRFDPFNTEEYSLNKENSFCSVVSNPLSTFAADVDTASYSNFRRFVNEGFGINDFPAGVVRTEEMINYFTYNYDEPKNNEIFNVDSVISDCPWNKDNKLLSIGINTKSMDTREIPASNIVFLIDVSGSMQDTNKLPLIKEAMSLLIEQFTKKDRISIVTYASGVQTILNGASGNSQREINKALEKLIAYGSTNGGDGIKMAYDVAEENFIKGGVNRVIICSDGDFNVGLTSQAELYDLISEKKENGIFLSVLGFGMYNYSDTNMETLADNGNGNYAYIDTLSEAKKVLIDEMTSTFVTVAKDVKLQVEFNPATVSEYRLVGYENRTMAAKDFTDDSKDGGELGAGHQVTVLYEIVPYNGEENGSGLKYQNNSLSDKGRALDEYCTFSIAYKDIDKDTSQYLEYPINTKNYTNNPDDDFTFASMVAMTSLALQNSAYIEDFSREEALDEVISTIRKMDLNDEYKEEFYDLCRDLKRH